MIVSLYITTVQNKLLLQYLPTVDAPNFKTLWTRIVATTPELISEHSTVIHGSHLSNNLIINKYYSKVNTIIYWCLFNETEPNLSIQSSLKWSIWLENLDNLLLDYFDKDKLAIKKITNNYDQITLIINACLNNGEIMVGSQYMNQIKDIIPMKSDFSKMINSTTSTIQNAVINSKFNNNDKKFQNFNSSFERSNMDNNIGSNNNNNNNNAVPWRRIPSLNSNNIGHTSSTKLNNEYYVDLIENVNLTLTKKRQNYNKFEILNGNIVGIINSKSYLYDIPMIEINFENLFNIPIGLPSLHNCIELNSVNFTNDMQDNFKLKFIPPHGRCQLMKYNIALDGNNDNNKRKITNVDLISCNFVNSLGYNNDEFEISINISGSNKIKKIIDLRVAFNFNTRTLDIDNRDNNNENGCHTTDTSNYKIRILRSTSGVFEQNNEKKTGTWIFDKETPTGTIATLRGCIERIGSDNNNNITNNDDSSKNINKDFFNDEQSIVQTEKNSHNNTQLLDICDISLNYKYEGQLFSGLQVKSIDITNMKDNLNNSQNKRLFKGVKYCTTIKDIEMRV